jgi:anti-sigma B factor antagonist
VTFLGLAGLDILLDAARAAQRRSEPLRVVVDHARPVLRPLQLTGLDDVLTLYRTREEAIAGITPPELPPV